MRAVETSCPEFEEPLLEDAQEAMQAAERIRDFILKGV